MASGPVGGSVGAICRVSLPDEMAKPTCMRITAYSLIASLIIGSNSLAVADEAAPKGVQVLAPGVPSPNTKFTDPNGLPVALTAFKGKVVILNVWATWCAPCVLEMPSLDRLAERLDDRNAMVLTVSQDKGGIAVAKPFLDRLKIKALQPYTDPTGKLSRDLGVRGLPTTIIIDPNGIIVSRVEGPLQWDNEEVARYLGSVGYQ